MSRFSWEVRAGNLTHCRVILVNCKKIISHFNKVRLFLINKSTPNNDRTIQCFLKDLHIFLIGLVLKDGSQSHTSCILHHINVGRLQNYEGSLWKSYKMPKMENNKVKKNLDHIFHRDIWLHRSHVTTVISLQKNFLVAISQNVDIFICSYQLSIVFAFQR